MSYHYSTLRFVPDSARGELVNLGIVVGDEETGDWDLRLVSGLRRAKAIDNEGRLGTALAFIASLEETVAADEPPISAVDLKLLAEEMRNVVQLTPPAPIMADSAAAALDLLFDELIIDPASRARSEKKWRAIKATLAAYRGHEIPDSALSRRAPVSAGAYSTTFDFAVHNGNAVQLVQCWSFQLLGQEELADQVKSWAWVARALQDGGTVLTGGDQGEIGLASDAEIAAVYVPPSAPAESRAFDEAQAAFQEAGVRPVPADDVDVIGKSAADRLGVAV